MELFLVELTIYFKSLISVNKFYFWVCELMVILKFYLNIVNLKLMSLQKYVILVFSMT